MLKEAMDELRAVNSPLTSDVQTAVTESRLAASIFLFADRGKGDAARLKALAKGVVVHGMDVRPPRPMQESDPAER